MLKALDDIRIATPCPASWADMTGDERVRFCAQCRLNVYNLSTMKREEAENLIREKEGRVCVRLYRRKDGTVLTTDCPVGLAARTRRRTFSLASALVLLAFSAVGCVGFAQTDTGRRVLATLGDWIEGRETPEPVEPLMGEVAIPDPPPPDARR